MVNANSPRANAELLSKWGDGSYGSQILTPRLLRQASERLDYFRRPSRLRMREELRMKTLPPDLYSVLHIDDRDDPR